MRIERTGAYANLVLDPFLRESGLDERDRRFVTELVYGTLRMARACDHLVDRFVTRDPDVETRAALRLGAFQLHFLGVPAHAAVSATVEAAPRKVRGFVNAVLRKVATAEVHWPDDATRLSYPDWIVTRLGDDLGSEVALEALVAMNEAPSVTVRDDGYVQDLASQWVAELVGAHPGERVADLCAAPGGKVTTLARSAGFAIGMDVRASRTSLVSGNAARVDAAVGVVQGDATTPPLRPRSFDRVLVDAPCTGLGTLRRRADARWRIDADAVERLAAVQKAMLGSAAELVVPGGLLVYSVCTLSAAETLGVDDHLADLLPEWMSEPPPGDPWKPHGRGALLLPQSADTDGMFILRLRRPDPGPVGGL